VAQAIKQLLCKCEALSSNPCPTKNKKKGRKEGRNKGKKEVRKKRERYEPSNSISHDRIVSSPFLQCQNSVYK
jgi:hypothetical protein